MTLYPVLVLDTETTGLPDFALPADHATQPRIIQIAAVLLDEVRAGEDRVSPVKRLMNRYIKPDGWKIDETSRAFETNKISNAMAEEKGVPIADALDEFMEMWAECAVFAAYGMLFDSKLLRGELRRLGRPDCFGLRPEVCLMNVATPICKIPRGAGWKFPKLREAVEMLLPNKPQAMAHEAGSDALDAARLYHLFAKRGLLQPKIREGKKA